MSSASHSTCQNQDSPHLQCQAPARRKREPHPFSSEKVQTFPADARSEIKSLPVGGIKRQGRLTFISQIINTSGVRASVEKYFNPVTRVSKIPSSETNCQAFNQPRYDWCRKQAHLLGSSVSPAPWTEGWDPQFPAPASVSSKIAGGGAAPAQHTARPPDAVHLKLSFFEPLFPKLGSPAISQSTP